MKTLLVILSAFIGTTFANDCSIKLEKDAAQILNRVEVSNILDSKGYKLVPSDQESKLIISGIGESVGSQSSGPQFFSDTWVDTFSYYLILSIIDSESNAKLASSKSKKIKVKSYTDYINGEKSQKSKISRSSQNNIVEALQKLPSCDHL